MLAAFQLKKSGHYDKPHSGAYTRQALVNKGKLRDWGDAQWVRALSEQAQEPEFEFRQPQKKLEAPH